MSTVPSSRSRTEAGAIAIVPLDAPMGAIVQCENLAALDDAGFAVLKQAYLDHLALVIRDQSLTDDELVAIARRFGELESPPTAKERASHDSSASNPFVTVVSNIRVNGVPIGELGDGEVIWHSDFSFREVPAGMRMLYGIEIPPPSAGGNTHFCNMYLAYHDLPAALKARIHGRTIKHDTSLDTNRNLRRGAQPVTDVRTSPGPQHPIVSTHPETGCNSLFLGRRPLHYVEGLSVEESEALLDELWAHATAAGHVWVHEWRSGDVVIWDNRCTLHHRGPFDAAARRLLHGAQVKGHRPFEAPDARERPPHPRGHAASA